jgi:hypothetical protein
VHVLLAAVVSTQSTVAVWQLEPSKPVAQEHEQASATELRSEEPVAVPSFCGW